MSVAKVLATFTGLALKEFCLDLQLSGPYPAATAVYINRILDAKVCATLSAACLSLTGQRLQFPSLVTQDIDGTPRSTPSSPSAVFPLPAVILSTHANGAPPLPTSPSSSSSSSSMNPASSTRLPVTSAAGGHQEAPGGSSPGSAGPIQTKRRGKWSKEEEDDLAVCVANAETLALAFEAFAATVCPANPLPVYGSC